MLLYLLLLFLVLAVFGGFWGQSRYGYVGWSPAAVVLAVCVIAYFTGHLKFQ